MGTGHQIKFGLMPCQSCPTLMKVSTDNFKNYANQVRTNLDVDRTALTKHKTAPTP